MKMNKKLILSYSLIIVLPLALFGQEKMDYLVSFTKAYGYVKYFHPSAEAAKIDWNKFSAYGANEILKSKNSTELQETMINLFKPLGSSINFTNELNRYEFKEITPSNVEDYSLTYWQHLGVATGMQYPDHSYKSILVNQKNKVDDSTEVIQEPIFEKYPKFGELIEKKIGEDLYCQIPLALYVDELNTYPPSQGFESLQTLVDGIEIDPSDLSVRLGNVINLYNVIQHFYPYFKEVDVDWDHELVTALNRCFNDQTAEDHLISLQKFTAPLKDGHLWIWQGESPYSYYPDIHWEWIQDSLVITGVLNDSLDISVGDVVTKINTKSTKEYFEEVNSRISYGTKSYLNYTNKTRSLSRKKGTELLIEVNEKKIHLIHHRTSAEYSFERIEIQKNMYKEIGDNLMYINLGSISSDMLTNLLPRLTKMKGIICDFRGHNYRVWDFVSHFSKQEIPSGYALNIPKFIYPDQDQVIDGEDSSSPYEIKSPYLGDIKTVFIVDGRTKSSSESFISTVKHSKLGTIIGEQTAGANGMINPFKLLGYYTVWWTGAKVTNPDGSQFHCIGIEPDISLEVTIEGIRSGKDEFLEKAIELIEN